MALSKIQAESMNLADTYAFSGTVSGTSVAGSAAFLARATATAWASEDANDILSFNNVSIGDAFDTDSVYNTTTYKFVAPATGIYTFWYSVYTANTDTVNAFAFLKNSARLDVNVSTGKSFSYWNGSQNDHIQTAKVIISLTNADTIAVVPSQTSDWHPSLSCWGGCRLA